MGTIMNDMMSIGNVVENIKLRNEILKAERKKMHLLEEQLHESQQVEEEEQNINNECRKMYLETVGERNQVELQLLKIQHKIRMYDMESEQLDQERIMYEKLVQEEKDDWIHQVQTTYGPQRIQMELYVSCLSKTIQSKQQQVQNREELLTKIKDDLIQLKNEGEQMEEQITALEDEVSTMKVTMPTGHDEEMSQLSDHFVVLMREKKNLRQKLNKLKDDRVDNDDTDDGEF